MGKGNEAKTKREEESGKMEKTKTIRDNPADHHPSNVVSHLQLLKSHLIFMGDLNYLIQLLR